MARGQDLELSGLSILRDPASHLPRRMLGHYLLFISHPHRIMNLLKVHVLRTGRTARVGRCPASLLLKLLYCRFTTGTQLDKAVITLRQFGGSVVLLESYISDQHFNATSFVVPSVELNR